MLKYSDSLWGNTSDCPLGIGPAPEYRESHTNAREYLIFASLNEVWVPQNAVQYFDIIHVDSKGGFPNHAAMAVGRGRFFLATYINPKMLSEEDWRIYAGLLNWARKNQDLLRQTEVVTSNVEKGEPYIYAHWLGTRGVLVVRNPSNATQAFSVDLRRTGAPPELRDAVCYSQYPYRRGIATGISNTSSVSLQLAPWELLFLEVVPRASLKEAVAIGARWYHEPQATAVVPDAGVGHVRILKPGGGEETMAVKSAPRPAASVAVLSKSIRPMPEAEWLTHRPAARPYFPFHYPVEPGSAAEQTLRAEALEQAKPETVPTCAFEFTFEVNVPAEVHRSKLLLLVEFPGRRFCPSECQATINGATVQLESSNSSNHTGFFVARPNNAWKDMAQFESQWCWYICEVKPGKRNVTFTGKAGHKEPRFRAWTWTTHDLSSNKLRTANVSSQPAMPQYEPEYEHAGSPVTL